MACTLTERVFVGWAAPLRRARFQWNGELAAELTPPVYVWLCEWTEPEGEKKCVWARAPRCLPIEVPSNVGFGASGPPGSRNERNNEKMESMSESDTWRKKMKRWNGTIFNFAPQERSYWYNRIALLRIPSLESWTHSLLELDLKKLQNTEFNYLWILCHGMKVELLQSSAFLAWRA